MTPRCCGRDESGAAEAKAGGAVILSQMATYQMDVISNIARLDNRITRSERRTRSAELFFLLLLGCPSAVRADPSNDFLGQAWVVRAEAEDGEADGGDGRDCR